MRVEVPQEILEYENLEQAETNGKENLGSEDNFTADDTMYKLPSKGQQPLNEQVLRVMQSLGIDPTRTTEVIENRYRNKII